MPLIGLSGPNDRRRRKAHSKLRRRRLGREIRIGCKDEVKILRRLTVRNVMMPSMIANGAFAWSSAKHEARRRAEDNLELVGLTDRIKHRPRQLSGGERQRVAIARALQSEPRFLFCDEPTGNLDGKTADDVRNLLWGLNESRNQTMVIVTHDARLAKQAHRIVHLVEGRIAHTGEADLVEEIEP